MRKTSLALWAIALLLPAWQAQPAGAEPKLRVAVLEFTEKNAGNWSGHVGQAAEDWFVDALVNTNRFQVMERQQLQALLEEHSFQMSGMVSPSTAAQAGKIAGVQYVVFGNIDFAQKEQGVHTDGVGSAIGGLLGRAIPWGSGSKKTSEGNLTARLVNVQTGEIVFSKSETVTDSNFKIDIMGTGAGTDWDETVVRKTFQPAVARITDEMASKMDELKESLGGGATATEGKVVLLKEGQVYLNLGRLDGVQPGDRYEIVRAEVIKDPDTGEELGRDEQPLGNVTVEKISGDHLSICRVDSGAGFDKGDLAKRR